MLSYCHWRVNRQLPACLCHSTPQKSHMNRTVNHDDTTQWLFSFSHSHSFRVTFIRFNYKFSWVSSVHRGWLRFLSQHSATIWHNDIRSQTMKKADTTRLIELILMRCTPLFIPDTTHIHTELATFLLHKCWTKQYGRRHCCYHVINLLNMCHVLLLWNFYNNILF